jgi:hypothetical protein
MIPNRSTPLSVTPPPVGPEWTAEERLGYIAWVALITLRRIAQDNPTVPLLSKRPVRDLFAAIAAVATREAEALEIDRAALMKPYIPSEDHHGVHVPGEWLELLAELGATG